MDLNNQSILFRKWKLEGFKQSDGCYLGDGFFGQISNTIVDASAEGKTEPDLEHNAFVFYFPWVIH